MTETFKRFGPELLRTLFIATVTSLTTMYGTVQTMNVELHATRAELVATKEIVTEVRAELKIISKLAAERGIQLTEHERRLSALEKRR